MGTPQSSGLRRGWHAVSCRQWITQISSVQLDGFKPRTNQLWAILVTPECSPCPSLAVAYHVCPLSGQGNLCSDFPFGESTQWYITSYRENAPCIWLPSLRALLRFAPTLSEQRFTLWVHWRLFICSLAELFSAFLHCVKASESVLVKVFLWVYIFGFTRNGVNQRYEYVYV